MWPLMQGSSTARIATDSSMARARTALTSRASLKAGASKGDGGAAVGVAGAVAHLLVVQVEAERRLHAFAQVVQRACFGRNQGARVAVDVDALRVTALDARGP